MHSLGYQAKTKKSITSFRVMGKEMTARKHNRWGTFTATAPLKWTTDVSQFNFHGKCLPFSDN